MKPQSHPLWAPKKDHSNATNLSRRRSCRKARPRTRFRIAASAIPVADSPGGTCKSAAGNQSLNSGLPVIHFGVQSVRMLLRPAQRLAQAVRRVPRRDGRQRSHLLLRGLPLRRRQKTGILPGRLRRRWTSPADMRGTQILVLRHRIRQNRRQPGSPQIQLQSSKVQPLRILGGKEFLRHLRHSGIQFHHPPQQSLRVFVPA